jgi:hypothetical protein
LGTRGRWFESSYRDHNYKENNLYTVEFDHDELCITIMDDTGEYGDLKIHSFDDVVFLCQDDPELDTQQILEVNPEMWEELIAAIHSPEGFFMRTRK